MSPIILTRGHVFEMGTFGELRMPDGFSCYTCERPWQGNRTRESCIPPGVYELRQRNSDLTRRLTNGRYSHAWEVQAVPERSAILIHPGNSIEDTEGCILPGKTFGCWDGLWTVAHSQKAFDQLMKAMGGADSWTLEIRYAHPAYP